MKYFKVESHYIFIYSIDFSAHVEFRYIVISLPIHTAYRYSKMTVLKRNLCKSITKFLQPRRQNINYYHILGYNAYDLTNI